MNCCNFDSSLQLGDVCITKMSTVGVSGRGQGKKGQGLNAPCCN